MTDPKPTGTREWAQHNVNLYKGCRYACLYCYARHKALTYRRINEGSQWQDEELRRDVLEKGWKKRDGIIMFPSTHDIHAGNWQSCCEVLAKLLDAGNYVLIVTKGDPAVFPHLDAVCRRHQPRVAFRLTITCLNDRGYRQFWEPNAPTIANRIHYLRLAADAGYWTSVSMEPLLEPPAIDELVGLLKVEVTHPIWVGLARELVERTAWAQIGEHHPMVRWLLWYQKPGRVWEYVRRLNLEIHPQSDRWPKRDHRLIRWKDSIRELLAPEGVTIENGLVKAKAGE